MTTTTYNGWTNYETWLVKLWMAKDYGDYQYWSERVQDVWENAEADHIFTRVERATLDLADVIKAEHGAALSEVNWHEIAEHLMSDLPASMEGGE